MPRAYDRAITIFSPEGRLYQVEYALELVKKGAPIIGVLSGEGSVLAANETPESRLEDPVYFKKIFQLDEHIGAAIAGLSSDARVLINQAPWISKYSPGGSVTWPRSIRSTPASDPSASA